MHTYDILKKKKNEKVQLVSHKIVRKSILFLSRNFYRCIIQQEFKYVLRLFIKVKTSLSLKLCGMPFLIKKPFENMFEMFYFISFRPEVHNVYLHFFPHKN